MAPCVAGHSCCWHGRFQIERCDDSDANRDLASTRHVLPARPERPLCSLSNVSEAAPAGSRALAKYLRLTYGAGADPSGAWSWGSVDLIWLDRLPGALTDECSWPVGPTARGSAYQVSTCHHRVATL